NIVPHKDLTCLVAKASADECMLWHRRLDETSGIFKKFITEIENLKDLKVKIIRCENRGEFSNKEMNDFCSQKGIKREFSNAKSPQQNGVVEWRNRTLIEAARAMVLVNKSHNKTPYKLFNCRSPGIGFLKPFDCHVMILTNLDNLGKFEKKGDKGYFIGYSMSSKVFRVFNNRTRRVEENLHVEFLENKAIEKGVGLNWLFNIDYLTKSMNYMPVDAGTISTNISGTKDATSQKVKKNVSSLRYIALPNWAHDALLESSPSKPQDHCSTKVLEGSGNLNLTASTSNPPADLMETLTVETLIPTASSPSPTAYSTDSQEPSSDARLISKRVANQEETPSLDNILSLTNQFKDILRVTTNSDESNGVKADISNMETAITTSPTPTLIIHKDHPKIEPKKISDALQDPSWVEAMQEELLQFKIQNVWTVVDCPKGMDVKNAFLYGTINEEVYVMQPPVFQDLEFLKKVYKVEKAMYGLHQAPRAWYGTLSKYLLKNGFQRGDILKKFEYLEVRSSNTPMDKENPWGKDGTGKDVHLHLHRSMIGSLMYLTTSRPEVKRIFRYLKGHPKLVLWYPKESPFDLVAYSDSDYGGAS
nr:hypothetical protein [Tanacetum cinerariifolium]